MKILITADPFIPVPPLLYGGIERIIDMLINEYIQMGHEVTLIAHQDSNPAKGCKLISYSSDKDEIVKNMSKITMVYLKNNFDVIHSFSRLAYLLPVLPLKVAKVMSYQREPTISQIKNAVRLAKKNSLAFTGCSNYISDQIKDHASAFTVYNGVPLETYDFAASVEEDAPLVFLGRIEPIKGTHLAIQAAQRTGKRLIIAGNIPDHEKEYFEKDIKPFLNDRITYIGPVNDVQKNEMLKKALAFLMPITWNEPFGIVMAEAMACGTPVIGFERGAVKEVVIHGINGFKCTDLDGMVNCINLIHSINRAEVRKDAEARFSSKVLAQQYLNLYQNIKDELYQ